MSCAPSRWPFKAAPKIRFLQGNLNSYEILKSNKFIRLSPGTTLLIMHQRPPMRYAKRSRGTTSWRASTPTGAARSHNGSRATFSLSSSGRASNTRRCI
jgi:hypothetical protein